MPNSLISNKLHLLANQYKPDPTLKFKYRALIIAIDNISAYQNNILSGDDAKKNIKAIGPGIAKRIDEIIKTGTLAELRPIQISGANTLKDLLSITGVGETRAKEWIKNGIDSVDKVRTAIAAKEIKSTHHIDLGLEYHDDLLQRIPRDEVAEIENILKKEIYTIEPDLIYHVCGSYRRGRATCGDVDVLFTDPRQRQVKYLNILVEKLTRSGFLIGHLTTKGSTKYMGICKIRALARRIDIRFVNYPAYYAAMVYFTGSKNFNIEIRRHALKMGYSLNEYGLTKKGTKEIKMFHSEEELFKFLDMDYVLPVQRDI